jgi:hypothetical protein
VVGGGADAGPEGGGQEVGAFVGEEGGGGGVARRGEGYRNAIADLFVSVLAPIKPKSGHVDPVRERQDCFPLIFSAMTLRTAYGSGFGLSGDPETLMQELVTMAQRYLLHQSEACAAATQPDADATGPGLVWWQTAGSSGRSPPEEPLRIS